MTNSSVLLISSATLKIERNLLFDFIIGTKMHMFRHQLEEYLYTPREVCLMDTLYIRMEI